MGELVEIRMNEDSTLEVDVDRVEAIVDRRDRYQNLGSRHIIKGAILVYLHGRVEPFTIEPTEQSRDQTERIRDLKNNPEGILP